MVKATLKSIDIKIANLIALIVYNEALYLAILSLNDSPFPVGHDHLLLNLLDEGKTTFAIKKKILNKVEKICLGKAVSRLEVGKFISDDIQNHKQSLSNLIHTRKSMVHNKA